MTKEEAIKYLQQLYPNGGHCRLDEQRIEAIGMAIKVLKEEPVSEDLEKAAVETFKQIVDENRNSFLEIFKAGAKWKAEQMQSTIELAEDHAMLAGMNKMEQQMIEKAIDGKVCAVYPSVNHNELQYSVHYPIGVLPHKYGDKVKVIVIKEE